MRAHQEVRPGRIVHTVRQTTPPGLKFNYELFNCNNFNIRYWSWNYRGCWPLLPLSHGHLLPWSLNLLPPRPRAGLNKARAPFRVGVDYTLSRIIIIILASKKKLEKKKNN